MLKSIALLILGLAVFQTANATQPDTLLVFYKNNGRVVDTRDSADYFRFIMPPDKSVDADLYRVYDFYMDGKPKRVANSLTGTINVVLDGSSISYFDNGKRKNTMEFKNGRVVNYITNYYPNGELYTTFKIDDSNNNYYRNYYQDYIYNNDYYNRYANLLIVECRDSTGKILAANGNGHLIVFDEKFEKVISEGDIKNNKQDGEWKGVIGDTGKYVCTYHKGELKSGTSYMKSGKQYNFKQIAVQPQYDGGIDDFYFYIKKNTVIPESVKQRKISGNVIVDFIINANGTVSDAKIAGNGLIQSANDEAVRVISYSPMWTPAKLYGVPVPVHYRVTVGFYY